VSTQPLEYETPPSTQERRSILVVMGSVIVLTAVAVVAFLGIYFLLYLFGPL
jgi:hypothetical protein